MISDMGIKRLQLQNHLKRTILLRPSKYWRNKFPGLVIAWLDNPFLEELSNFQINRYGLNV